MEKKLLSLKEWTKLGTTATTSCTASSPNLKTPVITFVNAHTISHYLQTSVLSSNKTLSIECCSEISINLVFRSQCYFASIFYSTAYVFYIINFYFLSYISFYVACAFVICLIKYLLTYFPAVKTRWNMLCVEAVVSRHASRWNSWMMMMMMMSWFSCEWMHMDDLELSVLCTVCSWSRITTIWNCCDYAIRGAGMSGMEDGQTSTTSFISLMHMA